MKKQEKVLFIHSISMRILFLVFIVVELAIVGSISNARAISKRTVGDLNGNYILSMAETSAQIVDGMDKKKSETRDYEMILKDVEMKGISSSYAYLVSDEGIVLYHPNAGEVGKKTENSYILEVVKQLKSGTAAKSDQILYEQDGRMRYAAYALTDDNRIVVMSADADEIGKPVDRLVKRMATISISSMVLCLGIGYILSIFICKPIRQLTSIIYDTADLNFKRNEFSEKLCARKDETGVMARAVRDMRANLRSMVKDIDHAGVQIRENVTGLWDVTRTVDSMCADNSATSQELAAGMQETAATTVTINENIGVIRSGAEDINMMAADGAKTSEEIMERADDLRTRTVTASNKTMEMYQTVKVKANEAIEGSRAVEKINELTQTIMEISSQTGLLALNASIEAARAGEAGRGFAVVATEIGSLADQTSKAIADINTIVREVNLAVENMTECLEETNSFLENTVITEYKGFEQVSEQYREDADVFKASMEDVRGAMRQLSESIETIVQALGGINETVGESAIGVTDIAGRTSDMAGKTGMANQMVAECNECVENLRSIVERFHLE